MFAVYVHNYGINFSLYVLKALCVAPIKYFEIIKNIQLFCNRFVFACLGMVELVLSSETIRKIQVEYGVTGSFKDKPLAEWLRKYNPAEDEYEKVNEYQKFQTVLTHLYQLCCVEQFKIILILQRYFQLVIIREVWTAGQ